MKFLALTTVLLLASTVARADSFDIRSLEIAPNGQQTQVVLVTNGVHGEYRAEVAILVVEGIRLAGPRCHLQTGRSAWKEPD